MSEAAKRRTRAKAVRQVHDRSVQNDLVMLQAENAFLRDVIEDLQRELFGPEDEKEDYVSSQEWNANAFEFGPMTFETVEKVKEGSPHDCSANASEFIPKNCESYVDSLASQFCRFKFKTG